MSIKFCGSRKNAFTEFICVRGHPNHQLGMKVIMVKLGAYVLK